MTIQVYPRPKPSLTNLQTDRIDVLEKIGKISAANIKIKLLIKQFEKQTIVTIESSFNNWIAQLPTKLNKTSKKWSSKHSYWTSRDKLVNSYCNQFRKDLTALLKQWIEEDLKRIIESYSVNIYEQIRKEFYSVDNLKMRSSRKSIFVLHNCLETIRYNYQECSHNNYTSSYTGDNRTKKVGFFEGVQSVLFPTGIAGGVGLGARAGLGLLGFAVPVIPVVLAIGSIASIVNIAGTDEDNSPELYNKIKSQVIELGCADIKKTELPKVIQDIVERIKREVFAGVINCADDGFACAISQYESIFELLDRQIDRN